MFKTRVDLLITHLLSNYSPTASLSLSDQTQVQLISLSDQTLSHPRSNPMQRWCMTMVHGPPPLYLRPSPLQRQWMVRRRRWLMIHDDNDGPTRKMVILVQDLINSKSESSIGNWEFFHFFRIFLVVILISYLLFDWEFCC